MSGFVVKQKKQKIVFLGDSITEAGVEPSGYISVLGPMINQKSPGKTYELVGAGISGNKVTDLYLRLEKDVMAKKPYAVVIWVGVNDVWHKSSGTGTDINTFSQFYERIVTRLQKKKIKVIMCTPAAIGEKTDGSNSQDADLNVYADTIRKLAQRSDCKLIDLRKAFVEYDRTNNPENKESGVLTSDGVHLNDLGNRFVAEEILKVLIN